MSDWWQDFQNWIFWNSGGPRSGTTIDGPVSLIENALDDMGKQMDRAGEVIGLSADDRAKLSFWAESVPFLGDTIRAKNNWNRANDYLDNTGQSWSDVKYGMSGGSTMTSLVSRGTNFVSDNIKELYS